MASITMEKTPDCLLLKVEGEANIMQAVAFKEEIGKALAGDLPICLDIAGSTCIDLAFLQIILAAQRAAELKGVEFAILPETGAAFGQIIKTAALDNHPWPIKKAAGKA